MVLLRRTLNQGLPSQIAENIIKFLPRPGKETSGTIHSKFKNGSVEKDTWSEEDNSEEGGFTLRADPQSLALTWTSQPVAR